MSRKPLLVLAVAVVAVAGLSWRTTAKAAADVPTGASPSWQTNGKVRAIAYAGGAVYLGGDFTAVRPPGAALGDREVRREHLAAFSATSGALLPFDPGANGTVYALELSPDKRRLYAGGDFTAAGGAGRGHLAAFDLPGGTLSGAWKPRVSGRVKAISTFGAGGTIYVGGTFGQAAAAGQTGSAPRTNVAAFTAGGGLLPFAAGPDASVRSLIASADGRRLAIGGSFDTVNGIERRALALLDTASGRVAPQQVAMPACTEVTTFARTRDTIFVGGEGTGGGCFEGTIALDPATGRVRWLDDCRGATQAVTVIGPWLYVGSHAHDCSRVAGGFPEVGPGRARHLMRQSVATGRIDSNWFPNTSGNNLGPLALGGDGGRLGVGGDFLSVNNRPQQGFTQFG